MDWILICNGNDQSFLFSFKCLHFLLQAVVLYCIFHRKQESALKAPLSHWFLRAHVWNVSNKCPSLSATERGRVTTTPIPTATGWPLLTTATCSGNLFTSLSCNPEFCQGYVITNNVFMLILFFSAVNLFLRQLRDLLYKQSSAVVGFVGNDGLVAQVKGIKMFNSKLKNALMYLYCVYRFDECIYSFIGHVVI